jgi:hypothetical protein
LKNKLGAEIRKEYKNGGRCADFVSRIAEVLRKIRIVSSKNRNMLNYFWVLYLKKPVLKA